MKRVLIGGLAVVVAGLAWLAWRGEDRAPAATPPAENVAPAGAPVPAEPATAAATPPERRVVSAAVPPTRPPGTATLKGRCVDAATGAPLAGCEVRVYGDEDPERIDAFLRAGGKVAWRDPAPQRTAPDGAFAFTFVPPEPYQFRLVVSAGGRVGTSADWGALEPGAVVDLGDVALARGSRVSGRVADSDGVPQAGVGVRLEHAGPGPTTGVLAPRRFHEAQSSADGTFAFAEVVACGSWEIRLRERQLVAPRSLEIPDGQTHTTLTVETAAAADVETITGMVVDEAGAPLRGVEVEYDPHAGGRGFLIATKDDGTFAVDRRPGDPDGPVRLRLDGDGYEYFASEERYPWGAADLRLVLRRCLSVDVAVTDRATGEPIEDYGVRCFPEPGGRMVSTDYEVRNRDHHPGGRTTVEGIRRGRNVLVVEPLGDTWPSSDFVRFDATDAGAPAQHVMLDRNVSQTLRVQRAGGQPVAGTAVQLLRPWGTAPITAATLAVTIPGIMRTNAERAIVVQEGETDARGELVLRGPPRTPLGLRVLGPGHPVWCDPAVTLVEGAPLVITVSSGATVIGTIGPPELLQQVRPADAAFAPGVVLRRGQGEQRESCPPDDGPSSAFPLNEDGTFRAPGVPPGDWSAYLIYWHREPRGGGWSQRSAFLQALPGLEDGEERAVNAQLGHLLAGTVSGTVLHNGTPLAGANLELVGRRPDGEGGEQRVRCTVPIGADGTFTAVTEPAAYRLEAQLPRGGPALPVDEAVTLAPGQVVEQVFHVRSGALRLRVLRADGGAVAGIEVLVRALDASWSAQAPKTDAKGRTTLDAAPPGTVVLTAVPKRLTAPEAARAFWRDNAGVAGAWEKVQLQLGRAEIATGGEADEVEVRLPAGSEY